MSVAPLVTVVLPVRNGGALALEAARSVLGQTEGALELVVLDSGSDDGTPDAMRALGDPRVRVVEAGRPLTMEENWARIVELDLRPFVTWLGHDDLFHERFLADVLRLAEQDPGASVYLTQFAYIDAGGSILRNAPVVPARLEAEELLDAALGHRIEVCGTGTVMRAETFRAIGGIPVEMPKLLYSDLVTLYRAARLGHVATLGDVRFYFRRHGENVHLTADLDSHYVACQRLADVLAERDGDPRERRREAVQQAERFFLTAHRNTLLALAEGADGEARARYRRALAAIDGLAADGPPLRRVSPTVVAYQMISRVPGTRLRRVLVHGARAAARPFRSPAGVS